MNLYPRAFDIKNIKQINANGNTINVIFNDGSISTVHHVDFNHFTGTAIEYTEIDPWQNEPELQ
jgi:hypothetical protein